MNLKNRQELKELLWNAKFDKILIWRNGDWDLYAGNYYFDGSEDDPIHIIKNYEVNGDIEHIDVFDEMLDEIEEKLKLN
ncbi:hypothetical protein P9H28_13065 [Paenibacillus barengoltzii]|uniref:hypothetical protein n=1 Tax=Paenibacillus barengoltzii TaxID=343517 RepID=UPI002DBF151B|nr:hypothetical protein [Paenibacillus barengoltzii]MEC2345014.1 hypothetical protein [Paenibacillus barengoltzii]